MLGAQGRSSARGGLPLNAVPAPSFTCATLERLVSRGRVIRRLADSFARCPPDGVHAPRRDRFKPRLQLRVHQTIWCSSSVLFFLRQQLKGSRAASLQKRNENSTLGPRGCGLLTALRIVAPAVDTWTRASVCACV